MEKMEAEETVSASDIDLLEDVPVTMKIAVDYNDIVSQKLREYAELRQLAEKHPEFREELQNPLEQLAGDSLVLGSERIISIADISLTDSLEVVSDSLRRIPFNFTVTTSTGKRKDSLIAVITTTIVEIDGVELRSHKVSFEPQQ
ncbi:MAG: hypothetical protein DWP94_14750 [Flavobacterium sp.]|nr:MAG: hypothetical protein DWP94_14750 [Flavobacterium sp.]